MGHTTTCSRACDKNPINTTIVQLDAAPACPEVVVTMGGTQQQSDSSITSNGNVPSPPSVPPQSSGSLDTELSSGDTVLELPIDGTYTSSENQKETVAEKGVSDTLEAVVADELEAGCSVTRNTLRIQSTPPVYYDAVIIVHRCWSFEFKLIMEPLSQREPGSKTNNG